MFEDDFMAILRGFLAVLDRTQLSPESVLPFTQEQYFLGISWDRDKHS